MGWKTYQPHSIEELYQALVQLHENRTHIKTVKVDHAQRMIRVDLDWLANTKMEDFMIPLKNGTTNEVDDIIKTMLGDSQRGIVPSRNAAERIFQLIDVKNR